MRHKRVSLQSVSPRTCMKFIGRTFSSRESYFLLICKADFLVYGSSKKKQRGLIRARMPLGRRKVRPDSRTSIGNFKHNPKEPIKYNLHQTLSTKKLRTFLFQKSKINATQKRLFAVGFSPEHAGNSLGRIFSSREPYFLLICKADFLVYGSSKKNAEGLNPSFECHYGEGKYARDLEGEAPRSQHEGAF
ncbi:hypothetical protein CEXT_39461 [Caerostris extrusa]|uniref:Uncharacterized protein n=1 Tax=Caerostris extrusa TaxID=172846 RepID=A0AAV4PEL8_CAEEX|nr:hypothetical protein CEXT_39461 [Caerostris extrusa]